MTSRSKREKLKELLKPFKNYGFLKSFPTLEETNWKEKGPFYRPDKSALWLSIPINFKKELDLTKLSFDNKKYSLKIKEFDSKKFKTFHNLNDLKALADSLEIYGDKEIFIELREKKWKGSLLNYYQDFCNELTKSTLFSKDLLDQLLVIEFIKRAQNGDVCATNIFLKIFEEKIAATAKNFNYIHYWLSIEFIKSEAKFLCFTHLAGDRIKYIISKVLKEESFSQSLLTKNLESILLNYIENKFPYKVWVETGIILTTDKGEELLHLFKKGKPKTEYISYSKFLQKLHSLKGKKDLCQKILIHHSTCFKEHLTKKESENLLNMLCREANPLWGLLGNAELNKETFNFEKRNTDEFIPGKALYCWLFGSSEYPQGIIQRRLLDLLKSKKEREVRMVTSFDEEYKTRNISPESLKHFSTPPMEEIEREDVDVIETLLDEYKKENKVTDRDAQIIKIFLQKKDGRLQDYEFHQCLEKINLSERQKRRIYSKFKKWLKFKKLKKD